MKIPNYSLLLLIFFNVYSLNAQVRINEYSCSNWSLTSDNYDEYEDWIELYNPTISAVDISGFYLSDRISQPTKWKFPAGTIVNPNSFLIVWASGRDEVSGNNYHANFRLSQTKFPTEEIVFSDASANIIDHQDIELTQKHHSRGRKPDAGVDWKIYLDPSPGMPNVTSTTKQRYAFRPAFNLNPGFYNTSQIVSITTSETNSTIRYTLNGSEPTSSSPIYSSPIIINSTTVLRAITISSDPSLQQSFSTFGTFFINDNHSIPVVSISSDSLQDLANGDGYLKPQGTIEYFNINGVRKTTGYGEFNRHGQDSWANDQRSIDFVMRDEAGYNYALQEQFFGNLTNRDEFQRVILRAAGDDNYPAAHHAANEGSAHLRDAYVQNLARSGGLDLDVRVATKAIVYINGSYWGVYDIREIPDDHDFTNYYYGQGKYKIQYIETWGTTWAEYGGNQALSDWNDFFNYVMSHDMTIAPNWDYVNSQLDVKSLVDYVIVNSVSVCSDWLNFNTGWWRGLDSTGSHRKWGYILWDNDAVFGFYQNYTGIPEKGPLALPCNVESNVLHDPEGHIDLLNKLRDNTSFNHYYINRYIDLSNSIFSCDYMLNTLDSISDVIDPEMTRHAQRWFGTYAEWKDNVQELRDYINQRCTAFGGLLNTCYNLTGPYPLHITTTPIGAGKIKVNSLTLSDLPWTGNYHGGLPIYLTAIPDSLNSFVFDRWETQHSTILPTVYLTNVELTLNSPDTLVAHFHMNLSSIPESERNDFFALAYPSVFSSQTNIEFYQPANGSVVITLFSALGKPVQFMKSNNVTSGINQFTLSLNNKGISPGIYLLNFKSEKFNKTIRLVYTGE